jgi:hypothetical protein
MRRLEVPKLDDRSRLTWARTKSPSAACRTGAIVPDVRQPR